MIQVAVADGHAIVRAALRHYFNSIDVPLVAEAATFDDALDIVKARKVDVLMVDLPALGAGGTDALRALKTEAPKLRVLVFSGFPEKHHASRLLKLGAAGYLNKTCDLTEIIRAVRTVARGQTYQSAACLDEVVILEASEIRQLLSAREFEVFLGLAAGSTLTHVADEMGLSVKTVSTYRARVLEKLALDSNSDLTCCAHRNGLLR